MAAALLEGASIGPLVDLAIKFDPRYVFSNCAFEFGDIVMPAMLLDTKHFCYILSLLYFCHCLCFTTCSVTALAVQNCTVFV